MSPHPILSVCIPTYNRAPFLRQCLESIAPQIISNGLKNRVDIVIADNASADDTEKVVAEFITTYPSLITYFKNEVNLGFDRSFTKLIEKSQGTYCLCLGDDDALFDNSLSYLVELLEKNPDAGLVWVNNWGYDINLQNPIAPHPNLPVVADKKYQTLTEYVQAYQPAENLVGFFVGLSSQLMRRNDWVSYKEKDKYFDTLAVHMHINLQVFKSSPFILISKPIVKTRASNIRWDVFAGLETTRRRAEATIKTATWIKDLYNLPISNTRLRLRIRQKEYWGTFKETIKGILHKSGLNSLITLYRNVRNGTQQKSL